MAQIDRWWLEGWRKKKKRQEKAQQINEISQEAVSQKVGKIN